MTGTNYTADPDDGTYVQHVYLSTACLHEIHEHCKSPKALDGEDKLPATCKWCATPCVCACHRLPPDVLQERIEAIVDQALAQYDQDYAVNVEHEISTLVRDLSRQSN